MGYYPYEYFCGANVVLELDGQPIHEAAGITYNIRESRLPLYGYSSRHWDAMARGQVLVQGSIVINYIHQDYILRSIETGREFRSEISDISTQPSVEDVFKTTEQELLDSLANPENAKAISDEILTNPDENTTLVAAMQNRYWPRSSSIAGIAPLGNTTDSTSINPHDMNSSVDIRITFGDRSPFNGFTGTTGLLISGVYFVSRGMPIQIDEEVIVEEYSFVGRNVHALKTDNVQITGDFVSSGDQLDEFDFELSTGGPQNILLEDTLTSPLGPLSDEGRAALNAIDIDALLSEN